MRMSLRKKPKRHGNGRTRAREKDSTREKNPLHLPLCHQKILFKKRNKIYFRSTTPENSLLIEFNWKRSAHVSAVMVALDINAILINLHVIIAVISKQINNGIESDFKFGTRSYERASFRFVLAFPRELNSQKTRMGTLRLKNK